MKAARPAAVIRRIRAPTYRGSLRIMGAWSALVSLTPIVVVNHTRSIGIAGSVRSRTGSTALWPGETSSDWA